MGNRDLKLINKQDDDMWRKVSYRSKVATMKRDRDALLRLIDALQGGPKGSTTYFFKLLCARTSSVGIINYLICDTLT